RDRAPAGGHRQDPDRHDHRGGADRRRGAVRGRDRLPDSVEDYVLKDADFRLQTEVSMLSLIFAPIQEQHAASGPLTVEFGLMFWTVVVFLLLLLILKRFAYPALLGAVEARERALQEQLDAAERNRTESEALLAEHKKLVAEARASAHALLVEARTTAEKERALDMEKTL